MADSLTPTDRSARMALIRSKDTKIELAVRRLIYSNGFRYRLHDKRLPGKPDLVFTTRKKVVFVHGCFWHRHFDPDCKLARLPKSNLDFWAPKLEANRVRDSKHQSELDELGWDWIVVWECELRHTEQLENKVVAFLSKDGHDESR